MGKHTDEAKPYVKYTISDGPACIEQTFDEDMSYLDIKTPGQVRSNLVRLIKMYRAKKIEDVEFNNLTRAFKTLNDIIKDSDIENRMKVIEEFMAKKGG